MKHPPSLSPGHIRLSGNAAEIIIFSGVTLICLLIAFLVFRDFPYSMDEYNYWYQAQIFASGKRYLDIKPWQQPLVEMYMLAVDGRLFSKYPPGYSAVLSLGALFGATGVVTPVISGLTALVLFLTIREAISRNAALLVTLLLASNSYFLGYGSSYFAHPLSLLLYALGFRCLVAYLKRGGKNWLIALGILAGACFFVRPLDAFCLLAAMLAGLLFHHHRDGLKQLLRLFAIIITPLIVAVTGFYTYNWLLSGCFCIATYPIWDFEFKVVHHDATDIWDNLQKVANAYYDSFMQFAVRLFAVHFAPVIGWPFLLLATIGCIRAPWPVLVSGILSTALLVLLYNFHHTIGWPQYGARYWYPALAPLALFAGYGIVPLLKRLPPVFMASVYVLIIVLQLNRLASDMQTRSERFRGVLQSITAIERKCPEQSVVVMLPTFAIGIYAPNLARNPFLEGPRLFAGSEEDADRLLEHLPGYRKCVIRSFW